MLELKYTEPEVCCQKTNGEFPLIKFTYIGIDESSKITILKKRNTEQ